MKKNTYFPILMSIVGTQLLMMEKTGLIGHIILSAAGLVLLVVHAVKTGKEWKKPVPRILMYVCYAAALVSGVMVMTVEGVTTLPLVHGIIGALFLIFVVIALVQAFAEKPELR